MNLEYGGNRSFSTYINRKNFKIPLSYKKKYHIEIEENKNNKSKIFENLNFYIDDIVNSSNDLDLHNSEIFTKNLNSFKIKKEDEFFYRNKNFDYYEENNLIDYDITPYNLKSNFNFINVFSSGKTDNSMSITESHIYNSYINKKEQLEILILKNGGTIHNTLTNQVTHIISNNIALGSKKYSDYKRKIKRGKIFIVTDKFIFDCVNSNSHKREGFYLPKALRYNSYRITDFFSFIKKKTKKQLNDVKKNEVKNIENSILTDNMNLTNSINISNNINCLNTLVNSIYVDKKNDIKKDNDKENIKKDNDKENIKKDNDKENIIKDNDKNISNDLHMKNNIINDELKILNMNLTYEQVKKYIVKNCDEYFEKLYHFYHMKELKENMFSTTSELYINENNFEYILTKYRIRNHLTDDEIKWIKNKSNLNIKIKNMWKNDFVHFFFNIVLNKNISKKNNENLIKNKLEKNENLINENLKKNEHKLEEISEKLIDTIDEYFNNSRLYILGNWKYISKTLFNFENFENNKKFIYLYIDFDYFFLNASINKYNTCNYKKNIHNSIFCVCHSVIKEESYGIISSLNYWASKNKIFKGMLKKDAIKINKNINFIKYNFPNILRSTFLLSLVLRNYSKNVKICSVDESIIQIFYNKEDIFSIAKNIVNDIYALTKLTVSVGISENLEYAKKAVRFCKKRFLFFDFYHSFNIFLRNKFKEYDTINNSISNIPIDNLFNEYLVFEEKKKKKIQNINVQNICELNNEMNLIDIEFFNYRKQKNNFVDDIFNKFMDTNKENIENITNTFFEKIIDPISKYFFFYKKNKHYLNILRKFNYLNGFFINFNIYYLPLCNINTNINSVITNNINNGYIKNINNYEPNKNIENAKTKHFNININYGVRFQKINDFYFLLYFMSKQLYLRLKIKKAKIKLLDINYFIRDENENINPIKYLGRGNTIRIRSVVKLNCYTNFFLVLFFKILCTSHLIKNKLTDLRGVQIITSDIIYDLKDNKNSILRYFKNINKNSSEYFNEKKKKRKISNLNGEIENLDNSEKNIDKLNISKQNKELEIKKKRKKQMKISDFENEKNRKKRNVIPNATKEKNILSFCLTNSKEINKTNINNINKNYLSSFYMRKKSIVSFRRKKSLKFIEVKRNYKIKDFFPFILKKKETNIVCKNISNFNSIKQLQQHNVFDSIINVNVKKELIEEENENTEDKIIQNYETKKNNLDINCYDIYKKECIFIKEIQKKHQNNNECLENIYCYICICNKLNSIYQTNVFQFYLYIKEITFLFISHFMDKCKDNNCNNLEVEYLHKFIAIIIKNICEMLHKKRYIDVLNKFLINFKQIWNLHYNFIPCVLQNIFLKYLIKS